MKYVIVSGFYNGIGPELDWFHHLWWRNMMAYTQPRPKRVFIFSVASRPPAMHMGEWIELTGNPGGPEDVLYQQKPYFMTGASATYMAGCWLAYLNEMDVIFLEQDTLAFGPWVRQLYDEVEDAGMIFGRNRMFGSASSIMLVRHRFVPDFCQEFIREGREDNLHRLSELKLRRMAERWPEQVRQFSFGYDRDRPYNAKDKVFYIQKTTPDELHDLQERGLVSDLTGMPDVPVFSNHPHP